MAMSAPIPQQLEAYVGDTETGVVHRYRSGCANVEGVFFLDVRTALIHGYQLCTCCAAPRPVPGGTAGVPARGRA